MKKNSTLLELLAGIIFLGVIIQIVCVIVSKNHVYDAIGLWCGIGICCYSAIEIQRSILRALDREEANPSTAVRLGYAKRMAVSLLIMGAVLYFKVGNMITLLIGVFPLKIAAYMQPLTHKLFLRFQTNKREVE